MLLMETIRRHHPLRVKETPLGGGVRIYVTQSDTAIDKVYIECFS